MASGGPPSGTGGRAVAFSGGGFLSHAGFTGLVVELLRARGRRASGGPPTLEATALFEGFSTISTVSGGSWFVSELAYSRSFRALVEEMATAPTANDVGELFRKRWVEPWLAAFSADGRSVAVKFFEGLRVIKEKLGFTALAQDVNIIGFLWSTGLTWSNFMEIFLRATAELDAGTLLGSPVQGWANGKVWLVGHSMATPTGGGLRATLARGFRPPGIGYTVEATFELPLFVPAKFSVVLGSGPGAPAPVPYCAESALDPSSRCRWEAQTSGRCFCPCGGSERTEFSGPLGRFANFTDDAGSIPLASAVGCSSAFLGGVITSGTLATLSTVLMAELACWATGSGQGAAFREANGLTERVAGADGSGGGELVGELASAGLRGLVDGAYTENTGVAHAVATGASEVVVFLSGGSSSLMLLFPGEAPLQAGAEVHPMALGVQTLSFPIFKESRSQAEAEYAGFKALAMPASSSVLQRVLVGTIKATTADSAAFGIASGRTIDLHIVALESPLSIGFLVDFREYAALVSQIVEDVCATLTMKENEGAVDDILSLVLQGKLGF